MEANGNGPSDRQYGSDITVDGTVDLLLRQESLNDLLWQRYRNNKQTKPTHTRFAAAILRQLQLVTKFRRKSDVRTQTRHRLPRCGVRFSGYASVRAFPCCVTHFSDLLPRSLWKTEYSCRCTCTRASPRLGGRISATCVVN